MANYGPQMLPGRNPSAALPGNPGAALDVWRRAHYGTGEMIGAQRSAASEPGVLNGDSQIEYACRALYRDGEEVANDSAT
jgi:hypothetical protein